MNLSFFSKVLNIALLSVTVSFPPTVCLPPFPVCRLRPLLKMKMSLLGRAGVKTHFARPAVAFDMICPSIDLIHAWARWRKRISRRKLNCTGTVVYRSVQMMTGMVWCPACPFFLLQVIKSNLESSGFKKFFTQRNTLAMYGLSVWQACFAFENCYMKIEK